MDGKSTEELEHILEKYDTKNIDGFFEDYSSELLLGEVSFRNYFNDLVKKHNMTMRELFILSDISEGYGYKLISGQKRTQKRDIIIRLCICLKCTLRQTQHLLNLYGMQPLYPRKKRDAILMIALNEGLGNIYSVNELLEHYDEPLIAECGEL